MITELIVANCMIGLLVLGTVWRSDSGLNLFVKVWCLLSAIACLILCLKLEGYIIKLVR